MKEENSPEVGQHLQTAAENPSMRSETGLKNYQSCLKIAPLSGNARRIYIELINDVARPIKENPVLTSVKTEAVIEALRRENLRLST